VRLLTQHATNPTNTYSLVKVWVDGTGSAVSALVYTPWPLLCSETAQHAADLVEPAAVSFYHFNYCLQSHTPCSVKDFLPRDTMPTAVPAVVRCLSVRPSVILVYCIETVKDVITLFSQPGIPIIIVLLAHRRYKIPRGTRSAGMLYIGLQGVGKIRSFRSSRYMLETVRGRGIVPMEGSHRHGIHPSMSLSTTRSGRERSCQIPDTSPGPVSRKYSICCLYLCIYFPAFLSHSFNSN